MKKDDLKEIGLRIKKIRGFLGLNQKELAAKTKMPASNLSDLENGKIAPGYSFAMKLSNLLNVNLNFLFNGKGKMFTQFSAADEQQNEKSPKKQIKSTADLLWFIENSPLLNSQLIAYAAQYRYQNELMIDKDIEINRQLQKE